MNERIPAQGERPLGSGGGGTLFDEAPDIPATVTVSSGPYREDLPAGNLSVGEIRRRFGDRFDLDPHSQGVVDGHAVDDDVVVRPGQALMFTRQAGEKGAGRIPMNWSAGFQHGAMGATQHAVLKAGAPIGGVRRSRPNPSAVHGVKRTKVRARARFMATPV